MYIIDLIEHQLKKKCTEQFALEVHLPQHLAQSIFSEKKCEQHGHIESESI